MAAAGLSSAEEFGFDVSTLELCGGCGNGMSLEPYHRVLASGLREGAASEADRTALEADPAILEAGPRVLEAGAVAAGTGRIPLGCRLRKPADDGEQCPWCGRARKPPAPTCAPRTLAVHLAWEGDSAESRPEDIRKTLAALSDQVGFLGFLLIKGFLSRDCLVISGFSGNLYALLPTRYLPHPHPAQFYPTRPQLTSSSP